MDAASAKEKLRPYYLLWGFRKCGTSSLASLMAECGVHMPPWDESNIWLAQPEKITRHLRHLWGDSLKSAPYLVDLSTLTHLSKADLSEQLNEHGFAPRFIVCTRSPEARWLSAWAHMRRKKYDIRSLRSYLDHYEGFLGVSRPDLRSLEDELIRHDLGDGVKSKRGIIGPDYFRSSYPEPFIADAQDPLYQYRYFGETIDMKEKRPSEYVELPLERPELTTAWLERVFGIEIKETKPAVTFRNQSTLFNDLRNHPIVTPLTRRIPPAIRRSVREHIESLPLFPRRDSKPASTGELRAMSELIAELLSLDHPEKFEEKA